MNSPEVNERFRRDGFTRKVTQVSPDRIDWHLMSGAGTNPLRLCSSTPANWNSWAEKAEKING